MSEGNIRYEHGGSAPRRFMLYRLKDNSGVSGTGVVAHGVEFPSGQVVLEWVMEPSITVYANVLRMLKIHGHGGDTVIRWVDPAADVLNDMKDPAFWKPYARAISVALDQVLRARIGPL